ncbi:uncharacterized protein FRV6_15864 [Fusarium oxysporum]|uniref:Heterokaryon incompatibility domain-containing protein n=1 Tax=Fusarium oxysporum TaxID=5507 RepID=A0A2H3U8S7_FUSOX|nr:uncharacterized protein FRV6_15864 [Fusarium oxysporum]
MEGERLLEKLWREPKEEILRCLQCQKSFSGSLLIQTPEVARRVLDISARIYNGIERPGYEARELWLDYISVLQWSNALRSNILRIMDKLFSTAETTVLYFNDVSPNVVNELYKDKRTPERLSSVISVCNSKYFKRIWTAMEFIGSERVRMMISNYTYFPDLDDPAFLGRVFKGWKDEVRQYEKVHDPERKVQMGKSQVPWSLVARPERGSMTQGFSSAAKLALEIDGPDVRDSIKALGRTHSGNVSTSMEILEEKNEVNHLQRVLNKLYNSPEIPSWPTDGKGNIKWLGDVLSFSKFRPGDDQTVLRDNAARYGTIHCRPHDYTVEFILACQTPIRSQGPPPLKSKDIGSILVAINQTRVNNMATVTILTMLSQCLLNKDNITAHYFRASKYLLLTERKFRGDMNNPSQHSLMTKTPMLSQACDLTDSIVEAMITATG